MELACPLCNQQVEGGGGFRDSLHRRKELRTQTPRIDILTPVLERFEGAIFKRSMEVPSLIGSVNQVHCYSQADKRGDWRIWIADKELTHVLDKVIQWCRAEYRYEIAKIEEQMFRTASEVVNGNWLYRLKAV